MTHAHHDGNTAVELRTGHGPQPTVPIDCRSRLSRQRYTCYTLYVYDRCMAKVRTNIEIEETYVRRIMDRYGLHTKTEAVDLALRTLAGPEPMTRDNTILRG